MLREPSAVQALPGLPTSGRVVEVRGSTWAVTEVVTQGLLRSPADESVGTRQHVVVALQSLDEDRLGDELRVIWELEAGHTIAPDRGLPASIQPEGFDDPDTLGAFVDAVRWGAVTFADDDAYQSPGSPPTVCNLAKPCQRRIARLASASSRGETPSVSVHLCRAGAQLLKEFCAASKPLLSSVSTASAARSTSRANSSRTAAGKGDSTKSDGACRPGGRPIPKRTRRKSPVPSDDRIDFRPL